MLFSELEIRIYPVSPGARIYDLQIKGVGRNGISHHVYYTLGKDFALGLQESGTAADVDSGALILLKV